MSDEQAEEQAQAPVEAAPAPKWGDPISSERQAELHQYLDHWQAETDHGDRCGPFDSTNISGEARDHLRLTGADVSWLAAQSRRDLHGYVPQLHLEGADLTGARLEGAFLVGTNLAGARLYEADLKRAIFNGANLEDAIFSGANLDGANFHQADVKRAAFNSASLRGAILGGARLENANLAGADLDGAFLGFARLYGAQLDDTHLKGASLKNAYMDRAYLGGAVLDGADLTDARLKGAYLRRASFDKASRLNGIILTDVFFDQVIFDNTNLTVVDWSVVPTLGDERTASERKDDNGRPKRSDLRLEEYKAAVRANRVLSVSLSAQGLTEDGDRFAYRAKVLQRRVLWHQRKFGAYLFSWVLAGLAGYGYRIRRIFIVYGLAVLLFAVGYFLAGGVTPQAHLSLQQQMLDSLQVSLNAIHGRVFFTQLGLDTLQSWLATLESIVGIVIEGVFVAMLIQRFFAR